jgi:DNA-binding GntR family transcriptional regulator
MSMIKTTLAEQAYQELRSLIVSGRLSGGQRLLPNELASQLGISPTPVKEACLRLEADGLLVNSARRGMVVRSFNEEDVEELEDNLENHRRFATGSSLDDLTKALTYDRAFHSALVGAARIPMISETHTRIVSQTHTVFVSIPGDYSRSVEEHQDILDAVAVGKKSQIVGALQRHLERSRQNTLRQVKVLAETLEPSLL